MRLILPAAGKLLQAGEQREKGFFVGEGEGLRTLHGGQLNELAGSVLTQDMLLTTRIIAYSTAGTTEVEVSIEPASGEASAALDAIKRACENHTLEELRERYLDAFVDGTKSKRKKK